MEQPDRYQQRYLEHQQRKRTVLVGLLQERHSERAFADKPLGPELHAEFASAYERSPSSCDRRGVTYTTVTDRDRLELLGGMLVGGVGWVHRAPVVFLLFADLTAYKAPGEATRMPYLDAGVIVGQWGLTAAALGLVGCFVNPNVREMNQPHFMDIFAPGWSVGATSAFCGAYAVGHPREEIPPWVLETS